MVGPDSSWRIGDVIQERQRLMETSVVAIGTFDGVHRGHAAVLQEAIKGSREKNIPAVAVTFNRHPATLLAPQKAPQALTSLEDKVELILKIGIDHVVVLEFDDDLAQTEASQFVEKLLCGFLGARQIVVGFDFKFGRHAAGNIDLLTRQSAVHGYELSVVKPVKMNGQVLSSTVIRRLLQKGRVDEANALLGRPFTLRGTVVPGDTRGREIGFPTANIDRVHGDILLPGDGVYVSTVNESLQAVTVIGTRPSFGDDKRVVETHILDFDGNLYGKTLRVSFLHALRGVQKFHSPEQLASQIRRDVGEARQFFAKQHTTFANK